MLKDILWGGGVEMIMHGHINYFWQKDIGCGYIEVIIMGNNANACRVTGKTKGMQELHCIHPISGS